MKRETGENPVRTRHRVLQAEATDPLGEPGREQMDHRTVCGIIQFYFRCLRFLTEAFFGYIFGRS